MKTFTPSRLVMATDQVRRDFPNALMADGFKATVEAAESDGRSIEVTFMDAIWGRTVLEMKATVLG
jgi:hypothetical protein